jgi:Fe-S-cluster formation regulator IscX/YfhJ
MVELLSGQCNEYITRPFVFILSIYLHSVYAFDSKDMRIVKLHRWRCFIDSKDMRIVKLHRWRCFIDKVSDPCSLH